MKKTLTLVGTVVALGLIYTGSAWFLGKQVESTQEKMYQLSEQMPNSVFTIVKRDYQRHLFSATQTVVLEVKPFASWLPSKYRDKLGDLQPSSITINSTIKHGPFPGLSGFGAAREESEFIFDDATQEKLNAIFKEQKPLVATTLFGLSGGGSTRLSSPAFTIKPPDEEKGEFKWDGIQLTIDFTAQMKTFSITMDAPGMQLQAKDEFQIKLDKLLFSADYQRPFEEFKAFSISPKQKFSLAEFDFQAEGKPHITIKNLVSDGNTTLNADFIDIISKTAIENIVIDQENYGPANYDFSLKHLHAKTLAQANQALIGTIMQDGQGADAEKMLAGPLLELLKYQPQIAIERVRFKIAKGEALFAALAKLDDAPADQDASALNSPFALLQRLNISLDLSIPRELLAEKEPKKLAMLLRQKIFEEANSNVKTKIVLSKGQLVVNGQAMNPFNLLGLMDEDEDGDDDDSDDE